MELIKEFKYWNSGLALSIGLVIAALIVGWSYTNKTQTDDVIQVTGAATKRIQSDLAKWDIGLKYRVETLETGYRTLEDNMKTVETFLIESGLEKEELTRSSVSASTTYKRDSEGNLTDEQTGYEISQKIFVESAKVDKIGEIARNSGSLIKEGLLINADSPQYFFTGLSSLKIEMLGKASKNAYLRASEIAENTSSSIGTIRSARMGVMQITAAGSTEVSDYGINDTSSVQKDVTAVVKASFAVN